MIISKITLSMGLMAATLVGLTGSVHAQQPIPGSPQLLPETPPPTVPLLINPNNYLPEIASYMDPVQCPDWNDEVTGAAADPPWTTPEQAIDAALKMEQLGQTGCLYIVLHFDVAHPEGIWYIRAKFGQYQAPPDPATLPPPPPTENQATATSAPFCRNVMCMYSDGFTENEAANFSNPPNAAWGNFSVPVAALQKSGYVDTGNGNGYCPPFHCTNAQSRSRGQTNDWYLNGDYSAGQQCLSGDTRVNLVGTKSITSNPIFCVPPSTPTDPPIVPPPSYVPGSAAATPPPSPATCSPKAPFIPWGGTGSATITVSGGTSCSIGWNDTPGGPGGVTVLDSIIVSSPPKHGVAVPLGHSVVYTPPPPPLPPKAPYKGPDSFTLTMKEHNGGQRATLTVNVSVTIQ